MDCSNFCITFVALTFLALISVSFSVLFCIFFLTDFIDQTCTTCYLFYTNKTLKFQTFKKVFLIFVRNNILFGFDYHLEA